LSNIREIPDKKSESDAVDYTWLSWKLA